LRHSLLSIHQRIITGRPVHGFWCRTSAGPVRNWALGGAGTSRSCIRCARTRHHTGRRSQRRGCPSICRFAGHQSRRGRTRSATRSRSFGRNATKSISPAPPPELWPHDGAVPGARLAPASADRATPGTAATGDYPKKPRPLNAHAKFTNKETAVAIQRAVDSRRDASATSW
jgi:hypothetical protein